MDDDPGIDLLKLSMLNMKHKDNALIVSLSKIKS